MKKILICSAFLLYLHACKNEAPVVKTKPENGSSSSPAKAQDSSSNVVKDNSNITQSEKEKTLHVTKNANKIRSGSWPKAAQDIFLSQCRKEGNFMRKDQAKDYCNCMLMKIQDKFPNLEEAGKMTQKEAHAFSQSCLK